MSDLLSRLQTSVADLYAIECELGRGGMATVFLARDRRLDRKVAIKVLHQDLSQALGAERFRREIEIATRLSHPHILPLYDSGEADGLLYYVMPYVTGESLRARLKREQQLPVEDTIKITCEVASALDYAHRQGVVHRDIKPENILLEDGHAVVADFGIARAISASQDAKLTQTGVTLGTPMYMSPEQACAEPDIDGRSDQYSLAAVSYEMLAGQPPFVGPTAQAIIARQMLDDVPSLTVVRRTIPLELEDAVLRALSKVKADRFPTVGQFADALTNPTTTRSWRTTTRSTTAQRRPWSPSKRRAVFAAWALAFVGGGAAAGWAGWKYVLQPARAVAASSDESTGLDPRHVAVLYFNDESKGGKLAFLADGLTESLIDQLGDVRTLDVLSANGAAALRTVDLSQDRTRDSIAHALRIGTIVRGSVEEEGNSYRVTVRLVDAASGAEYKRGSFEQPQNRVLAMRDSLAGTVASFLRARLGEEVALRESRIGTRNADAWALAQRAERLRKDAAALAGADSSDAARRALNGADSLLARAESLDSSWALPAVARAEISKAQFRLAGDPSRGAPLLDEGLVHAGRAIAIDPRNAAALEARGTLRYMRYLFHLEPDPRAARELLGSAESDLKAATTLDGSRAGAWNTLSHLYAQIPNFTEAKLAAQRAYEADAYLSFASDVLWRLYASSYELEQFSDAGHWCDEGGRRFGEDPRFVRCQLWLLATKARTPDVAAAWRLGQRLDRLTPAPSRPYQSREAAMAVAAVIARAGQPDSARHVLERSRGDAEVDPTGELMQTEAYVRGMLGTPRDKDEAFKLLKRYLTANPEHRKGYAEDNAWRWRALRDDPRYRELVGPPPA